MQSQVRVSALIDAVDELESMEAFIRETKPPAAEAATLIVCPCLSPL